VTLLLYAVLVGLALGLIMRGKIVRLSESPLVGQSTLLGLLVASLAVQVYGGALVSARAALWIWCSLAVACTVVAAMNFRRSGMLLVAAGLASNALVVLLNTGMPVVLGNVRGSPAAAESASAAIERSWLHVEATARTAVLFLADAIPVYGPSWQRGLVSLGDLMLAIGIAQYIATTMLWQPPDD